jgi:hypothetical protein
MDESIQKQLEAITTNPWVAEHPREALALRDLAAYVRRVPGHLWDYENVGGPSVCGTVGCAVGHAPHVPSCAALGLVHDENWTFWQRADGGRLSGARAFLLPEPAMNEIFYGYYGDKVVTQEMVADRIDHWLATGGFR